MKHDESYKLLFSNPEMVADLIRGFVQEPWVNQLQFDSLERVSGSFVTEDLRERENDIIWKLELNGEALYVYLLIEFQSTIDRFMGVRMLTYVMLLSQEPIAKGHLTATKRLPPILPLVLYNGTPRWSAPVELDELFAPVPAGLERYRPSFRYLLVDEGRFAESDLAPLQNLAAALFRLENSQTPEDVRGIVESLVVWLQTPEKSDLRRAFTVWLKRVFLPGRMPGVEFEGIHDLSEVKSMLSERVVEWTQAWKREGHREGFEEGRQAGLTEGEATILLRLIEFRFGTPDDTQRARILAADSETLLRWSERIFTAASLPELLNA